MQHLHFVLHWLCFLASLYLFPGRMSRTYGCSVLVLSVLLLFLEVRYTNNKPETTIITLMLLTNYIATGTNMALTGSTPQYGMLLQPE